MHGTHGCSASGSPEIGCMTVKASIKPLPYNPVSCSFKSPPYSSPPPSLSFEGTRQHRRRLLYYSPIRLYPTLALCLILIFHHLHFSAYHCHLDGLDHSNAVVLGTSGALTPSPPKTKREHCIVQGKTDEVTAREQQSQRHTVQRDDFPLRCASIVLRPRAWYLSRGCC